MSIGNIFRGSAAAVALMIVGSNAEAQELRRGEIGTLRTTDGSDFVTVTGDRRSGTLIPLSCADSAAILDEAARKTDNAQRTSRRASSAGRRGDDMGKAVGDIGAVIGGIVDGVNGIQESFVCRGERKTMSTIIQNPTGAELCVEEIATSRGYDNRGTYEIAETTLSCTLLGGRGAQSATSKFEESFARARATEISEAERAAEEAARLVDMAAEGKGKATCGWAPNPNGGGAIRIPCQ